MEKEFPIERFDVMKTDKVQIADFRYGHSEIGKLDVWIERTDKGTRFLRQVIVDKEDMGGIFPGVYTKHCYILREKETGHYHFLDMNDSGIWLFNASFSGSENFTISELSKIEKWINA